MPDSPKPSSSLHNVDYRTSRQSEEGTAPPLKRLIDVVARLRDPEHGCEWDLAQSFATLAPYAIEEGYEVADALRSGDPAKIVDELGDLLLQVVLNAQVGRDLGQFCLDDVATAIADKMVRRHPHVFAGAKERPDWDALKAEERGGGARDSVLDGVARGLPALMRADKIAARAARTGFDWPDEKGPADKVVEELAEVAGARTQAEREEEIGDLLFAAASLARKLGVDPETALAAATDKFERRFRAIEAAPGFANLTLGEKEALWGEAKRAE
jgi:nucleoside triphosphate diphosphatase